MKTYPATGACYTTLTPRLETTCECPTYPDNWGRCTTWQEGANGRCVYCDHTEECHFTTEQWQAEVEKAQRALDRAALRMVQSR